MWFDSLHNRNAIEHRLLAVDRADRDRGPKQVRNALWKSAVVFN